MTQSLCTARVAMCLFVYACANKELLQHMAITCWNLRDLVQQYTQFCHSSAGYFNAQMRKIYAMSNKYSGVHQGSEGNNSLQSPT
eukprot:3199493-Amphidinium_carterae.1